MSTSGSHTPRAASIVAATAVTNGSGEAVFEWPPGAFSAPPVVTVGVEGPAGFRSSVITANSAASTSVRVTVASGIVLLGIGVLTVDIAAPGITVHAHAVAA